MSKWVQLGHYSDWGQEYYAKKGEGLSSQGTSNYGKYAIPFEEGAQVRVRWPSGSETTERISFQLKSMNINDMGHEYDILCSVPGLMVDYHGVPLWVRLDLVEIHEEDIPERK